VFPYSDSVFRSKLEESLVYRYRNGATADRRVPDKAKESGVERP
jgi:hypothetical protein